MHLNIRVLTIGNALNDVAPVTECYSKTWDENIAMKDDYMRIAMEADVACWNALSRNVAMLLSVTDLKSMIWLRVTFCLYVVCLSDISDILYYGVQWKNFPIAFTSSWVWKTALPRSTVLMALQVCTEALLPLAPVSSSLRKACS
jgi:hypothetical protein